MEDKILEQVAQRYDTNEATVCAEIEYTWEDIQNIADPLLRRYWGLIDQPLRRPTAAEIVQHVAYAVSLCRLVTEKRARSTGNRLLKAPSPHAVLAMLYGRKKTGKVMRAAMQAAITIREEKERR